MSVLILNPIIQPKENTLAHKEKSTHSALVQREALMPSPDLFAVGITRLAFHLYHPRKSFDFLASCPCA